MNLQGLMQDQPLLISSLITHAERYHGDVEIVSHLHGGQVRRSNWRQVGQRARRFAQALGGLGEIGRAHV